MSLTLDVRTFKQFEVIHYFDYQSGNFIAQRANSFTYRLGNRTGKFSCPLAQKLRPFSMLRIGRRLARIDKGACLHLPAIGALLVFYQGVAYRYHLADQKLETLQGFNFRNPLFCCTTVIDECDVAFGEYFPNQNYRAVNVFRTEGGLASVDVAYTFPAKSIWHIHGVHFDRFTNNYWICTGDNNGECRIVLVDRNFRELESYGDGSQQWRAVSMLFLEDRVVWGMDSPLAPCHVMSLDRKTGKLEQGQPLPGPVWFSKDLEGPYAVLQTSVEQANQPGVKSKFAHLFATRDFDRWIPVEKWQKDRFSHRYFRHGVLMFADGRQTIDNFALHAEAVCDLDGRCAIASIDADIFE